MKLTRGKRIALELLGPAAMGAGIWILVLGGTTLWEVFEKGFSWVLIKPALEMAATILMAAYVFVGAQSIVYTLVMEWRFKRGLDPRSWQMVGISTALGFFSGSIMTVGGLYDLRAWMVGMAIWGTLGLVVGFLLGLLIKRWSTEKETTGQNPP